MSEAELRTMVREVLREALARKAGAAAAAPATAAAAVSEPVRLASDADLAAFVQRLVALLDGPAGAAVRSGRHRFTLAAAAAAPAPAAAAPTVLEGTVTEQKIARLAGAGTLVLAAGAVMTPLARDRARALGLKIERRR